MFSKLKQKIGVKIKKFEKAIFLMFASYLYDKIANRKSKKKKYIEDAEYEVKDKEE